MRFYIGGYAQGKTGLIKDTFPGVRIFDEESFEDFLQEIKKDDKVLSLVHFHLVVKKLLEAGKTPEDIRDVIDMISCSKSQIIVAADEIGNGIVPVDDFMRYYREEAGRAMIYMAERSEEVIRVICGMGMKIK